MKTGKRVVGRWGRSLVVFIAALSALALSGCHDGGQVETPDLSTDFTSGQDVQPQATDPALQGDISTIKQKLDELIQKLGQEEAAPATDDVAADQPPAGSCTAADGQVYASGTKGIPADCNTCSCEDGNLSCTMAACVPGSKKDDTAATFLEVFRNWQKAKESKGAGVKVDVLPLNVLLKAKEEVKTTEIPAPEVLDVRLRMETTLGKSFSYVGRPAEPMKMELCSDSECSAGRAYTFVVEEKAYQEGKGFIFSSVGEETSGDAGVGKLQTADTSALAMDGIRFIRITGADASAVLSGVRLEAKVKLVACGLTDEERKSLGVKDGLCTPEKLVEGEEWVTVYDNPCLYRPLDANGATLLSMDDVAFCGKMKTASLIRSYTGEIRFVLPSGSDEDALLDDTCAPYGGGSDEFFCPKRDGGQIVENIRGPNESRNAGESFVFGLTLPTPDVAGLEYALQNGTMDGLVIDETAFRVFRPGKVASATCSMQRIDWSDELVAKKMFDTTSGRYVYSTSSFKPYAIDENCSVAWNWNK